MKSAPTDAPAAPSRCRGAFYMRPDRTAGINGLAVIATRPWRHEGMPPCEAGRGCGGNRGPARADMKSAPTDAPAAPSRCRGAFYMRPDRTAGINGLAVIATRPWRRNGNGINTKHARLWGSFPGGGHVYAYSTARSPSRTVTSRVWPGRTSPRRIRWASRVSTVCWRYRFSGRAPYCGS